MKKITIILLFTLALGITATQAFGWSDFIKYLTDSACQGQSAKYKNGCYAYIEPRVQWAKSPSEALTFCKGPSRCGSWYDADSSDYQTCVDGCTFLYDMGE